MKFGLIPAALILLSGTAGYGSGKSIVTDDNRNYDKPSLQEVTAGKIDRHYIYSPQMNETITVDVWTPEGYPSPDGHRYPVIYMHDGQNLFDSSTTWNHQSWEMDSVTGKLIAEGEIEPTVIVGVHSVAQTRKGDLMPENALAYLKGESGPNLSAFLDTASVRGNAYAAFIVETLKPKMDAIFRLTANADSTFLMGSSMGGLMSVYAMSEYPETFGAAACLSTHWVGTVDGNTAFSDAMYDYLAERLPRDGRHRLYLDHGTTSLDSLYGPANERIVKLAKSAGYTSTRSDSSALPSLENFVDTGAGHEERYWASRVSRPLRFLLGR